MIVVYLFIFKQIPLRLLHLHIGCRSEYLWQQDRSKESILLSASKVVRKLMNYIADVNSLILTVVDQFSLADGAVVKTSGGVKKRRT